MAAIGITTYQAISSKLNSWQAICSLNPRVGGDGSAPIQVKLAWLIGSAILSTISDME
jgi:hypothetical protein